MAGLDPDKKISLKWLVGVLLLPSLYATWSGIVWAVDTRIQQTVAPQMQQLRKDVVTDFRKERVDFLLMKERANIITQEERIELEYLKERQN